MRLGLKTLAIVIGIPAVVLALLLPPYLAWVDYEVDSYTVPAPYPEWEYPFERGFEFQVAWSVSLYEKADWPYISTRNPETGVKDVRISATHEMFDVYDVWLPSDTIIVEPPKPSFTDYLAAYYNIGTLELFPADVKCEIRISCLFEAAGGDKTWHDVSPDDPYHNDKLIPITDYGDYSEDFVLYTRLYTGTYTFTVITMVDGNRNIGDASVKISVVNPYERL